MDLKGITCWQICVISSLILPLISTANIVEDDLVVKTSTATIYGKRVKVEPRQLPDYQGSVLAFTRIPYAEPPLGKLRFSRPVPKVLHGEFSATKPSNACFQTVQRVWNLGMDFSEDCLFLDVFVPEPKPKSAAVLVWIHGGGFHMGAGSIPAQLPIPLATFGDVIVVTCNYRLGPLGFLTTGDENGPANIGFLDQRQALLWVQENIQAFGGDPSRVTIVGQSAGSMSVNFQLVSPMSAGLFARAIMQSGAIGYKEVHHTNMEDAVQTTARLAKVLGCDATDSSDKLIACLRKVPVKDFFDAYGDSSPIYHELFFRPVEDGQFIPDDPMKLVSQEHFNVEDIMNGVTRDEGTYFMLFDHVGTSKPTFDLSVYRDRISSKYETEDPLVVDMIAFIYSTAEQLRFSNAEYFDSVNKMLGDMCMLCPTFALSEQLARVGKNVYTYVLTHVPSHPLWGKNYSWLGASHAEDLPYMFGSPFMFDPEDDIDYALTGRFGNQEEVEMSLQMMKYWSNFAKTGNPNLSGKDENVTRSKFPSWPKFTLQEPSYKELSKTFDNRAGMANAKECFFIKNILLSLFEDVAERARLKALLEEKVSADGGNFCDDPKTCP